MSTEAANGPEQMDREALVEKAADALHQADCGCRTPDEEHLPDYRYFARAVLDTLADHLVPRAELERAEVHAEENDTLVRSYKNRLDTLTDRHDDLTAKVARVEALRDEYRRAAESAPYHVYSGPWISMVSDLDAALATEPGGHR